MFELLYLSNNILERPKYKIRYNLLHSQFSCPLPLWYEPVPRLTSFVSHQLTDITNHYHILPIQKQMINWIRWIRKNNKEKKRKENLDIGLHSNYDPILHINVSDLFSMSIHNSPPFYQYLRRRSWQRNPTCGFTKTNPRIAKLKDKISGKNTFVFSDLIIYGKASFQPGSQ